MKKYLNDITAIFTIVLLGILFQINYVNDFPSHIHAWSQSDRYALAQGFVNNDLNFFKPINSKKNYSIFNLKSIKNIATLLCNYLCNLHLQGSLPSTFINTLAIDKDGEIWIGTDQGPVIFYSSYSIMNEPTYDAQKILIEQDGTLQYLLENERITDIEIDGANRKWISTDGGGVFLLSEEGTQTIYSFSKNNSPLYSDVINSLAINDNTGEVYIGSPDGIIGFKSTATSPNIQFKTLEVFPNPVRPEYQGNIAVRGMMNNSEVKIVNASGFPVKTVFSKGGQAIWDGLDNNNQQVGSGVYYFLATSEDGYSKAKSKVLIIR